ncbi:MAG TPA: type II toxin-antitoxin system HicB family antitoxin, partial [candidate division Zixibacteria bacterium]
GETMKLKVIIEKDESGYFVAEVPAMPGCYSQGKTIEEVKKNIKEAIEGWIEVMNEKADLKTQNSWKLKKYEICEVTV